MVNKVTSTCLHVFPYMYNKIQKTAVTLLEFPIKKLFFWNFYTFSFPLKKRHQQFKNLKIAEFLDVERENKKIETLYISSQAKNKTGNVIIFCWNLPYHIPSTKRWESLLVNGADIVLWNPSTSPTAISYSEDLLKVIEKIQELHPEQTISLVSYCASVAPVIKVAATLHDRHIHLIIDRGYGDVFSFSRSFTFFASLPFIRSSLEKRFNCQGTEKLLEIPGKILFLYPKGRDQVCDYGRKGNFTRDLRKLRPQDDAFEMENGDHWTTWDLSTYNRIMEFFSDVGIVNIPESPLQEKEISPLYETGCLKSNLIGFFKKTAFSNKDYIRIP